MDVETQYPDHCRRTRLALERRYGKVSKPKFNRFDYMTGSITVRCQNTETGAYIVMRYGHDGRAKGTLVDEFPGA